MRKSGPGFPRLRCAVRKVSIGWILKVGSTLGSDALGAGLPLRRPDAVLVTKGGARALRRHQGFFICEHASAEQTGWPGRPCSSRNRAASCGMVMSLTPFLQCGHSASVPRCL